MIRLAFIAVVAVVATPALAGQDVPPPQSIRPVVPAFLAGPPDFAGVSCPREMRSATRGWSRDRHIPVVEYAFADEDRDFDSGFDSDFAEWEAM